MRLFSFVGRGGENQTALLSYDQVVGLHGVIVFSLSEMNNSYIQIFWKGYNYYLHSVSLFSETKYIQPWNWYREDFKTDNKSRSITLSAESESDHNCRADCLFSQTKVNVFVRNYQLKPF